MAQTCPICNSEIADGAAVCERCGYRVIGSTQSFTPVKLSEEEQTGNSSGHRYDLRVVRGPQTGIDIDLREGTLSIGRDPQCDVFLNDMTVSREHAFIEVSGKGCVIRDQNSFNGTWVNDHAIEACALKPGDVIQIGAFCLIYRERP